MPSLDDVVKYSQICFFIGTLLLGVRTYIYAKKNLLNSVHLEYQKKVLNRLDEIARELWEEFDEKYEIKPFVSYAEGITCIDDNFEKHETEILKKGTMDFTGCVMPPQVYPLEILLLKVQSDPFIPKTIRDTIVDFVRNRLRVLREVYLAECQQYVKDLAAGVYIDVDKINDSDNNVAHHVGSGVYMTFDITKPRNNRNVRHAIFNSKVESGIDKGGYGKSDCEKKVNAIRLQIQQYFERYNPID